MLSGTPDSPEVKQPVINLMVRAYSVIKIAYQKSPKENTYECKN